MKRIVMILSLIIFVTGCDIKSFNTDNIDTVIEDALVNEVKVTNTNGEGYKYYLPRGMSIRNKVDYNTEIVYKEDLYYLYVDVIAYYYQQDTNYQENDDLFYSRIITYNDKEGLVEIEQKENEYQVTMNYNYAKLEAKIKEENLEEGIVNMFYILSTLKFNDEVLNTLVGENILDYQEESLDIFESKRENGDFLDYIEEYNKYEESTSDNKGKDEDALTPADTE